MQRRQFLTSTILLACSNRVLAQSAHRFKGSNDSSVAYIAASRGRMGEDSIVCLNDKGDLISEHIVPSRGHSCAVSSRGHIAAIARRPADFCLILDKAGNKVMEFQAPADRHFYGHGVFDDSGDYLYLTENDFDSARGVIGVYQASQSYRRVDEFDSHGVGPHQILFNSDNSQLIIANGGIETHPYSGRKKLNLPSMQPSIAFIDRVSGELARRVEFSLEYHANSIRHIAVQADNTVYIGLQNQGASSSAVLIAKLLAASSAIEKHDIPATMLSKLNGYVGDICLDKTEQYLIASSPMGNTIIVSSLYDNRTWSLAIDGVCGVQATKKAGEFVATSVSGLFYLINVQDNKEEPHLHEFNDYKGKFAWDNHITLMQT